jgi:hypothetical protein
MSKFATFCIDYNIFVLSARQKQLIFVLRTGQNPLLTLKMPLSPIALTAFQPPNHLPLYFSASLKFIWGIYEV